MTSTEPAQVSTRPAIYLPRVSSSVPSPSPLSTVEDVATLFQNVAISNYGRGAVVAERLAKSEQEQSAVTPFRKIRLGFWNKKGDHLVEITATTSSETTPPGLYVVRAPPLESYPVELADYPDLSTCWKNHHGQVIKENGDLRVLPESVSWGGQPAARPYSSVSCQPKLILMLTYLLPVCYIHVQNNLMVTNNLSNLRDAF